MAGVSPHGVFASREARARRIPAAVCNEGATRREAKRTAARRVAPNWACGFVAPQSQSAAAMLLRRAAPQAKLGATKHQPFVRHCTSGRRGKTIPEPLVRNSPAWPSGFLTDGMGVI